MVFVVLCLASFYHLLTSGSIHAAVNGKVSFFFVAE